MSRGKMALPNQFVFVVVKGKCYLIFQLTMTITVDLSAVNNNCPYRDSAEKSDEKRKFVSRGCLAWSMSQAPS